MRTSVSLYHRHRFPAEIISHCVWLYFRFPLSFRDVEEMLAMRGVALTYETVRDWCLKFGQTYANGLPDYDMKVTPDGKEIYVTLPSEGTVAVIDTSTNS